jgi:hypothetical protein
VCRGGAGPAQTQQHPYHPSHSIPYREWPRRRKRHPLPRPLLKNFIRDSTRRDPYPGAPFIVKEAYANRFGLAAELPTRYAEAKARYDAREAKKRRAQEASEERELDAKRAKAEAKEKLRQEHTKYPMEDKLLPRNPDLAARPVRACVRGPPFVIDVGR